jgi:putative RecB family exonuclease
MTYALSATKLVTYRQCPQSYYFKYERGLKSPSAFGSPELGNSLHQALAHAYQDWDYQELKPDWSWFETCWNQSIDRLTEAQAIEGRDILRGYYKKFVEPLPSMVKPLGIESRISATVQFGNIEFSLSGRYDRLDLNQDGELELIDYKTSKSNAIPDSIDVQLGLYYLALEQIYRQSLKRLTLIFLRSGESLSFDVTPDHQAQVRSLISDLATKLRTDAEWKPNEGGHCDRCTYQKYCTAKTCKPEPLPEGGRSVRQVQLSLAV